MEKGGEKRRPPLPHLECDPEEMKNDILCFLFFSYINLLCLIWIFSVSFSFLHFLSHLIWDCVCELVHETVWEHVKTRHGLAHWELLPPEANKISLLPYGPIQLLFLDKPCGDQQPNEMWAMSYCEPCTVWMGEWWEDNIDWEPSLHHVLF